MREVLNFVTTADQAFDWIGSGRRLSVSMLAELQRNLVAGTPTETSSSGQIRDTQVVIGHRRRTGADEFPVHAARFVPPPPGIELGARVGDLLSWLHTDHRRAIDPVVAAAMGHYQFETLHPFHDGNGRMGRLLIVLHLLVMGTLSEPTLTVSPWFEARRTEYYDRLLAVSTTGDWDGWIGFFAEGLEASATQTHQQMLALVAAQGEMKDVIRASNLRADTAHHLVDYAIAHSTFTVRQVQRDLAVSYGRANALAADLERLGLLDSVEGSHPRRFFAPDVMRVLTAASP